MLNKLLLVLLLLFFVVGGYVAYTAVTLPNVRTALESGIEPSQTSQIFARDKTLIMSYGMFQHKPLPLSAMPPELIEALLATEDRRFYSHKGIDPVGIVRALLQNIRSQGVQEGGSTLTQQLARNIFLSHERSIQRKVKEALLAIKLEQQLTKEQILELYLNNVYFGEGAYGVGAASLIYFGKSPKQLTRSESALLAGLPQAPSLYSPFSNPELAKKRRNEVLENLVETSKLTRDEYETYSKQGFRLNPEGRALASSDKAPFFNRYVIQQARQITGIDEQAFWQRGVKIYTTLDPRAQRIAESQVRELSAAFGRTGKNQQAALLSLNPEGEMIAYVGGRDFSVSQFDRVSQARRQAGSLFKVFVYTTALERGYSPLTVYRDEPVEFGKWKPENYDKKHRGFMTLAQALVQSNNVIAVKVLNDLTPQAVIQTAQRMGIESRLAPNLSLALGASDVTLKEMTGAFSVFSNNGVYIRPHAITKIVDRDGRVLYQYMPEKRGSLQRVPRDTMVELMEGVVKLGTGRAADFGRPAAGKTGTSDDYRDAWFIGFTPEMTTGVWVGNDDNSKMPGITGGSIPARIWRGYMSKVLEGMPIRDFDLAYALPVDEQDFFVYNLDNLSASEGPITEAELKVLEDQEDGQESPDGETEQQETYSFLDKPPQTEGPPPEIIIPQAAPVPQRTRESVPQPMPPAENHPYPSQGRGPAEDRYFDFRNQSTPSGRRFGPTPPGYRPTTPRLEPLPGNTQTTPPRPIIDPLNPNHSREPFPGA